MGETAGKHLVGVSEDIPSGVKVDESLQKSGGEEAVREREREKERES
jgi:hypothetical protein